MNTLDLMREKKVFAEVARIYKASIHRITKRKKISAPFLPSPLRLQRA